MKIIAKNFMSWKDLEFDVADGVTLIQGYNHDDDTPEGSGKSAILNALSWGLYGRIPKDAKIDDVIRDGAKNCEVRVEFDSFTVVRSRKPNDLLILSNDEDVHKGKDARETQTMIEELVGLSFETFCQSIYFAQNYPNKFITANQEDKGKILSEIQDLKQFDAARKKVQEIIKALKPEILKAEKDAERFEDLIEVQEQVLEDTKGYIEKFEKDKELRINSLNEAKNSKFKSVEHLKERYKAKEEEREAIDLDEVAESLEGLASLKEKIENYVAEYKVALKSVEGKVREQKQHKQAISRMEIQLNQTEKKLERIKSKAPQIEFDMKRTAEMIEDQEKVVAEARNHLENPEPGPCPTCGQDWEGDTKKLQKLVKLEEENLQSLVNTMAESVEDLEENGKEYDQVNKNLKELKKELKEAKAISIEVPDVDDIEEKLESCEKDLVGVNNEIEDKKTQLRDHKSIASELKALSEQIESTENDIGELILEAESEQAKEPTDLKKKLSEVKKALKVLKADRKEAETTLLEHKKSMNRLEVLKDGYREVKVHVFQSVLNELTRKANHYLTELFEVPVLIKFDNQDMKIDVTVTIDGEPRPLGLYSGGQFRRICLAVDLALSDITTTRKGNTLDLRIFDEYMKDLSESSMEKVLRLLENLGGSTLLIEHNSVFKSIVNNTFEVELVNGVSKAS